MNVYRYVASNSFMFAALFCNFASDNDNDKQSASEKEIKQLEEKLTSLERKLQKLSNKKEELKTRDEQEKQNFEIKIKELEIKNTEELDKIAKKNDDSILAEKNKLEDFKKKLENAKSNRQKKKFTKKIKETESAIDDLNDKADKQEVKVKDKQRSKVFKLEWGKEKVLLNLRLQRLDCDIKTEKINEDIEIVKEKLSRLGNYESSPQLKNQGYTSKSTGVWGSSTKKGSSTLEERIKQIEEKKSKLKFDFILRKKVAATEQKMEKLKNEIDILGAAFLNYKEKIEREIDEELNIELQKGRKDLKKRHERSIQKKKNEINTFEKKISKLENSLKSEVDNKKKESLMKEKGALEEKVKALKSELASLEKNDVLDKGLEGIKKKYDEKKKFLLDVKKGDIEEKWKTLGKLASDKKFLSEQIDYLPDHSSAEYKEWYKSKVLENSSFIITDSGSTVWDSQKDLDNTVKKNQKQAEKQQKDILSKNGYARDTRIFTPGDSKKDDDENKDDDDKELKLSKNLSLATLKTSCKLPKLWPGEFPFSLSGTGVMNFNFNNPWEDKSYKKFSVEVQLGIPNINVFPEKKGKGKKTKEEEPQTAGTMDSIDMTSEDMKDPKPFWKGGDSCSLFGSSDTSRGYSPLGRHLFLRKLVYTYSPIWMSFCKIVPQAGFRVVRPWDICNIHSVFAGCKFSVLGDAIFLQVNLFKNIMCFGRWLPSAILKKNIGVSFASVVDYKDLFVSFAECITVNSGYSYSVLEIGLRNCPLAIDLVKARIIFGNVEEDYMDESDFWKKKWDHVIGDVKIRHKTKPFKAKDVMFMKKAPLGKSLEFKSFSWFCLKFRVILNSILHDDRINDKKVEYEKWKIFCTLKFFSFDFDCSKLWLAKRLGIDKFLFTFLCLSGVFLEDVISGVLKFKVTLKQGLSFSFTPIVWSVFDERPMPPSLSASWNILDYINYRKANKKKTANTDF